MRLFLKSLTRIGGVLVLSAGSVFGQSAQQQGIASTTQILDTSVLFAIGAREAEQAIRGSFGWPTFQEGFVDRVYFRFDPDGYARFSTSPRLDEDVFEVICAESSTACVARKQGLEVGLTAEGKVQLQIPGITPQDSFFVSDRKSELPLPPTVLEPLDARMETLLASSGHLIVKRELEKINEISLSGFSAVSTYLRWVAQGQSPRVFPRGWPAPAQVQAQSVGGLTQPGAWEAPSAGPQRVQTTFRQWTPATQQSNFGAIGTQAVGQGAMTTVQTGYGAGATYGLGTVNNTGVPANGTQYGQQPTNQVGAPNAGLDQVQLMVQSLQQELAQLRNEKAQDLQTTQANPNEDFAQSFAQQAQARNLPEPLGYGADLDQTIQPTVTAVNSFGTSTRQNLQAASVPDPRAITSLEQRLYALEQAVWQMSQSFQSELASLKSSQQVATAPITNEPVMAAEPQIPSEVDRMDALERLLVERLGAREPLVDQPTTRANLASADPAELERERVLDMLNQLGSEPSGDVAATEPTVQQDEPEAKEEYISLADYLNEVLKSETKKAQGAE